MDPEQILLCEPQIELLLFFHGRGTAPRRVLDGHYEALLAQGLIETFTRRLYPASAGSLAYRITERGEVVAERLLAQADNQGVVIHR